MVVRSCSTIIVYCCRVCVYRILAITWYLSKSDFRLVLTFRFRKMCYLQHYLCCEKKVSDNSVAFETQCCVKLNLKSQILHDRCILYYRKDSTVKSRKI